MEKLSVGLGPRGEPDSRGRQAEATSQTPDDEGLARRSGEGVSDGGRARVGIKVLKRARLESAGARGGRAGVSRKGRAHPVRRPGISPLRAPSRLGRDEAGWYATASGKATPKRSWVAPCVEPPRSRKRGSATTGSMESRCPMHLPGTCVRVATWFDDERHRPSPVQHGEDRTKAFRQSQRGQVRVRPSRACRATRRGRRARGSRCRRAATLSRRSDRARSLSTSRRGRRCAAGRSRRSRWWRIRPAQWRAGHREVSLRQR